MWVEWQTETYHLPTVKKLDRQESFIAATIIGWTVDGEFIHAEPYGHPRDHFWWGIQTIITLTQQLNLGSLR